MSYSRKIVLFNIHFSRYHSLQTGPSKAGLKTGFPTSLLPVVRVLPRFAWGCVLKKRKPSKFDVILTLGKCKQKELLQRFNPGVGGEMAQPGFAVIFSIIGFLPEKKEIKGRSRFGRANASPTAWGKGL